MEGTAGPDPRLREAVDEEMQCSDIFMFVQSMTENAHPPHQRSSLHILFKQNLRHLGLDGIIVWMLSLGPNDSAFEN